MSFCIQEHASFGALYPDNEAPLGVSDVGQLTISLSAVRG